jgi:hypothetical protein
LSDFECILLHRKKLFVVSGYTTDEQVKSRVLLSRAQRSDFDRSLFLTCVTCLPMQQKKIY